MVSGSGVCAKRVVVDARHHMLGRLASIVAKELLNGQRVVVVRCEEICMSGGLVRQKMKPRGARPRSPGSRRTRRAAAVRQTKRMVIPDALKVLRLQPGHRYCLLGQLSKEVGWNYADTIRELEEKRKEKAKVSYDRRKQLAKLRVKAEKAAEEKLGTQLEILAPIKY
ncbi:hypothetical protein ZWY2020_025807 [Hordeum vulgare]|nr:hypothetical protein ZWY2020_025807 [Hordeum vulgare]